MDIAPIGAAARKLKEKDKMRRKEEELSSELEAGKMHLAVGKHTFSSVILKQTFPFSMDADGRVV